MLTIFTGSLDETKSKTRTDEAIRIDSWGIGIAFVEGLYVLNLYSQGRNYPEIIPASALDGFVQLLTAATSHQAQIWYWPEGFGRKIFVGHFSA